MMHGVCVFLQGIDGLQGQKGEKGDGGAPGPQVSREQRKSSIDRFILLSLRLFNRAS
jgi:hypothetical protein